MYYFKIQVYPSLLITNTQSPPLCLQNRKSQYSIWIEFIKLQRIESLQNRQQNSVTFVPIQTILFNLHKNEITSFEFNFVL